MLNRTYDDQHCSVARTLEVAGERWTFLIIRDALFGIARFDDFQHSLGIARNVLTDRLSWLVDNDVFTKVAYQRRPERFEYRLTPKGRALAVPLVALMQWGDKHATDGPAPRLIRHAGCGGRVVARLVCDRCDRSVAGKEVLVEPGPGARQLQ